MGRPIVADRPSITYLGLYGGTLKRSDGTSFDHVGYWRRSLFTATAARSLSRRVGLVQQEEAFLGGLLQDVGVVAMNQALKE